MAVLLILGESDFLCATAAEEELRDASGDVDHCSVGEENDFEGVELIIGSVRECFIHVRREQVYTSRRLAMPSRETMCSSCSVTG